MKAVQMEDFLKYRYLSSVCYAPDGAKAAFVVSRCAEDQKSYESELWLWDGALKKIADLGHGGEFIWEDEEHILLSADRTPLEKKRRRQGESFTSYYRLNVVTGEESRAFTLPFSASNLTKTEWGYLAAGSIDCAYPDAYRMTRTQRAELAKHYKEEKDYEVLDEIHFWLNGGGMTNKRRTALFTLTPKGTPRRITEPEFDLEDMLAMNGKVYFTGTFYTDKRPLRNDGLYCLDPASGEVTKVLNCPGRSVGSLTQVGSKIWCSSSDGARYGVNENEWVYEFDPKTGAFEVLRKEELNMYGSVGSDCRRGGGYQWQAKDDSLYFVATREGNAVLLRLDADGSSHPVITKPGSIDAITLSEKTNEALLIALYDNRLQELYAADLSTGEVRRLSSFNEEALRDTYVAEPRSMTIRSEGMDIEGWVLLPKDYDPAKTYPAVLDVHGGPKTVYGPVFYHEMQLWAGMGYFVFFCNPKGSDGRDNEFMDIRGDYGNTDFKNIMDFTDAVLAAYPQIDQKRVCVTGGSYGGFMTNWIIGHTNRFCCAASQRSISNWLSFFGVSDIGYYFAPDQCGADFYTQPEELWAHSPVKYASDVKTPTLFIHSDEDYRCPLEQGLQMYTALKDKGVPARLCLFHGENHELSRSGMPKHRARRLREITGWFEKYANKTEE